MQAIPGAGSHVPLWILGSSLFGAQLAAALGLPYAFASHFAPDALLPALEIYRAGSSPSRAAATSLRDGRGQRDRRRHRRGGAAAVHLACSSRSRTSCAAGRGRLPPPIDDIETYWSPAEKAQVTRMLSRSFVGSPDTVRTGSQRFVDETGADELIVAAAIHDHDARLTLL